MSQPNPQAHSVMDRLRLLASQRHEDFTALLARYGNERFLFRLGSLPHRQRFVLKGAMLFVAWLPGTDAAGPQRPRSRVRLSELRQQREGR
jgi:hypothetical protein